MLPTFPGSLLLATTGSAFASSPACGQGRGSGTPLDVQPLRWIGERSYGIYLWHWPVLVLLLVGAQGIGPEPGVPVWVGVLTLVLSVGAAAASYRFIEWPIRRYGFRHALRALGRRIAGRPVSRLAGLPHLRVVVVAIGGTTGAVMNAPHTTTAVRGDRSQPGCARRCRRDADAERDALADAHRGSRSSLPPRGGDTSAVGDSVMLASAPSLLAAFAGITVDAEVSRSIWAGPELLNNLLARSGELRENVVVALGTNGPLGPGGARRDGADGRAERDLILVNVHAPRD